MGWVKPGDVVLDCFGGVALGGLDAISMGLNWIGVELEEKFVTLGQQNIELWNRQLKGWPNLGTARIVQGDSRYLLQYLWAEKNADEMIDLVISSPPFLETQGGGGGIAKTLRGEGDYPLSSQGGKYQGYQNAHRGNTPGNLANMKEGSFDMCVSSPPYDEGLGHGMRKIRPIDVKKALHMSGGVLSYGESEGQLAGASTFWSASKEILSQCYDLLKPNGMSIWVCKDYVKAKKRVPFSDRWLTLCESVGFKLVCRHQAMLVKEHGTQKNIRGEEEIIQTERKSFFRRLHEKKYPDLKINWEDIICMIK